MKSSPINTPLPLIGWVRVTRPITWHSGWASERVPLQQAFTGPYCEGQEWCNNVRSTAVVCNEGFKANGKYSGSQTVLRETHRLREELTLYHKVSAVTTNSNYSPYCLHARLLASLLFPLSVHNADCKGKDRRAVSWKFLTNEYSFRDFRLPPWSNWELHSSGLLRSE